MIDLIYSLRSYNCQPGRVCLKGTRSKADSYVKCERQHKALCYATRPNKSARLLYLLKISWSR
jgi:hypothetical protein